MKTEQEWQNLNPGVKVIHIGQGKVVSNFGTHYGTPGVFIEPVLGDAGPVGQKVGDGREPQITKDSISEGGVILCFHSPEGASVIIEDIQSALTIQRESAVTPPIAPAAQDELIEELRDALWEAAQSLRIIADGAGRREFMENMDQVRGYANSRANVAHERAADLHTKENSNAR